MLRPYGVIGFLIMAASEALMFLHVEPVATFHTAIAWWGYILFIDSLVARRAGDSFLTRRRRDFALMAALSVVFWLVFEWYNLSLVNWYYEGLPPQAWLRWVGYAAAFASITPALLETGELLATFGPFQRLRVPRRPLSRATLHWSVVAGLVMVGSPALWPSPYLFAPVWVGFIFLLDPLVYWMGGRSLWRDLEEGSLRHAAALFVGGLWCGLLWEFWNYWAHAKWVYIVPIMQGTKIFEMPLLGYLGFMPFALECFVMFYWAKAVLRF